MSYYELWHLIDQDRSTSTNGYVAENSDMSHSEGYMPFRCVIFREHTYMDDAVARFTYDAFLAFTEYIDMEPVLVEPAAFLKFSHYMVWRWTENFPSPYDLLINDMLMAEDAFKGYIDPGDGVVEFNYCELSNFIIRMDKRVVGVCPRDR